MNVRWAVVVALGLVGSAGCAHRGNGFASVDAAIEKELGKGVPSIAVAIAKGGRVVHETAFGWADREGGVRATARTPYAVASVTKPFVATGVMLLAEQGRIALDQPARLYAGGWLPATAQYTVRQLLAHTSGLPTYATIRWEGEPSAAGDLAEMVRKYAFAVQSPGVVSEYSNLGYGVLGHILAVQSGTTLSAFLAREVFDPLGLRDTQMVETNAVPAGAARKYDVEGKALPPTLNDTPGAGNLYTSVHDLVRFGLFHLDAHSRRVLSPASKEAMRTYVEPAALYPYYGSSHYGLGWYFRTTAKGTRVVWHEGGMPGASSLLVLLPDHDLAAAVVINANDRNDVAQAVANRLIAAVEPSMQPLTFDATEGFVPYAAQPSYRGRWDGTLTVDGKPLRCAMTFDEGGKVTITFPDRADGDLLPRRTTFKAIVNGDLLVGTFAATLPSQDVVQKPGGYVLLRLVRRGDQLSGTAIAYASVEGLRHLYPFPLVLRQSSSSSSPGS